MRYAIITTICLAIAAAVSCGGNAEQTKNTSVAANTQATPIIRMIEPVANIDLPPATANKVAPGRTIQERANRAPRVDVNPNATPAPLVFQPAPENSQTALSMDADGTIREIRVFKDNPKLARVEVIVQPGGDRNIKFTMRDGKTSTLKNTRLENLPTAKAAELIAMAGR